MFIDTHNRSFLYGDGFFETLRVFRHQILLWPYHQMRILKSLACLHLQPPSFFSLLHLQTQILEKCASIKSDNHRVRVTFFRQSGGKYAPNNNNFDYTISVEPSPQTPFAAQTPIEVGLCPSVRLACGDLLANCKTNSALPYVLAAQYAAQQNWHDALLLNAHHRLAESSKSNLWLVFYPTDYQANTPKNKITIVTPPLSEGCVAGVMRAFLLETLPSLAYHVRQHPIQPHDLAHAQEIWLTNAIQGITCVQKFGDPNQPIPLQTQLGQNIQQQLADICNAT